MATLLDPSTVTGITSSASSTQSIPSFTDSASPTTTPGQSGGQDGNNTSIVSHYFVFIAFLLCIVGVGLLLMWRRKRKANLMQHHAYHQHVSERDAGPRGHWRRREGDTEQRVEGLNEIGEAPPPYVLKQDGNRAETGTRTHTSGLNVPLQTLSREQAALRDPPGYDTRPGGGLNGSDVGDYWRSPQRPG